MSDARRDFTRVGFAKTFLLPALLIFLVPVVSLAFFWHAQSVFNSRARESVLAQIRADANLSAEEREEARAFFSENPFSELVKNKEFAAGVDSTYRFYFTTFRWMIRLSALSIVASLAMILLVGLCVLLSMRSQQAQYLSLSAGWHALRIYGAVQAVIQGILLVALSFWVTALWFEFYSVKLVLVAGILAVAGVGAVIAGIFKRTDTTQVVEGTIIDKDAARPLWNELGRICDKVGSARPDQVVVGIDDNFFVTEMPVMVDGKTYNYRTLYVSLSLLKQMSGTEADAVLAHEMAHFSGNDTLFSKKISPLLVRYGAYLQALYEGGITAPIFYFMHGFRAMYEPRWASLAASENSGPTELPRMPLRRATSLEPCCESRPTRNFATTSNRSYLSRSKYWRRPISLNLSTRDFKLTPRTLHPAAILANLRRRTRSIVIRPWPSD